MALPAAAQDIPRMDVGIGYQFGTSGEKHIGETLGDVSGLYKYGFNADGSVPLNEKLSVVAELGWMRNSIPEQLHAADGTELPSTHANFNALNYGGGIRFNRRGDGKLLPFGQFILGAQRDTFDTGSGPAFGQLLNKKYTRNSFMVQPGAGVAIAMNETMSVVGQVDYRYVFLNSNQDIDDGKNVIRFVFGLRFNQR